MKFRIVSCVVYSLDFAHLHVGFLENERPSVQDLNRYVTRKFATDWCDIGIELGLEIDVLNVIEKENCHQSVVCFQKTLNKWAMLNTNNATWKSLEVALTNVNRIKLGLGPVDDIYGKEWHYHHSIY